VVVIEQAHRMIPTRETLLSRLRDRRDDSSWEDFFNTYWQLIYHTAMKAGLSDAEAQDVVQETVLTVCEKMPAFRYDPAVGSFKGWLLKTTQWRIADRMRKRLKAGSFRESEESESTGTRAIERIPDPASLNLEAVWEEEWKTNLLDAALVRVKSRVDPVHYQVFDFVVMKKCSAWKVSRMFKINVAQVYVIRQRVRRAITTEVRKIENEARMLEYAKRH
jgi:RNA polymerase sigma factor (sigma-70 family)